LIHTRWLHSDTQVFWAAKDVGAHQGTLIDLFSRVEYYFRGLEIYTSVPATAAMRSIIEAIMVEVISFLAIVTKEVKQGRTSELSIVRVIAVLD
jgi:hypothetical protein